MLEVVECLVIDDGNNPGLVSLAFDSDSFSLKVNVTDIEKGHFFTSQPKPEQRLDDASISEGANTQQPNINSGWYTISPPQWSTLTAPLTIVLQKEYVQCIA